jgi:hypothetical protein
MNFSFWILFWLKMGWFFHVFMGPHPQILAGQLILIWSNFYFFIQLDIKINKNRFEPVSFDLILHDPILSLLILLDLIWTDLFLFDLVWSSFIQFDPIWSNLVQLISLNPLWSDLNQFEPNNQSELSWSNLNQV